LADAGRRCGSLVQKNKEYEEKKENAKIGYITINLLMDIEITIPQILKNVIDGTRNGKHESQNEQDEQRR